MRKFLSILLTIIMVVSIAPVTVFAEDDILSYLTYEITNDEVIITACDTSISGDVVIPDTIEGYPVTTIGVRAFYNCQHIAGVTVPDSVTTIEEGAFFDCKILADFVIGNNVKTLGSQVFTNCFCLTDIEIPASVESLGVGLFSGSYALETITVDDQNQYYASKDGVLFDKVMSTLIHYPAGNRRTEYTVPDSVTTIGGLAFIYNSYLEKINMSENLTTIGEGAFIYCMSLKELIFPDSLNSLIYNGDGLCVGSVSLENVVLPENVQQISASDYNACLSLKSVTIYNKDIEIEEYALGYDYYGMTIDRADYVELFKEVFYTDMKGDREKSEELSKQLNAVTVSYDIPQPKSDFVIHGYEGSTAETYANENGFNFVALCRHNYVDTVITAPTYTQTGEGGMVCEHCGDVQSTYEIPMLVIEDSEEEKDEDTGVSVIFPDGTFDEDAEIEITPVEEGEAYKLISHKEGNYKVTMFDINVTVDGQKVQPNGTVLVKIPLPKGYNQNKCVVYYVADDGTMEELKTYHYKDGYVYFETDHFSYYAVVEETSDKSGWMDESLSFVDKLIAFFNMLMNFFKKIFGIA